jgi:hypothetical protein
MHVRCSKCGGHVSKVGKLWRIAQRDMCQKCRTDYKKMHGLTLK